jgi:hypothetical protein
MHLIGLSDALELGRGVRILSLVLSGIDQVHSLRPVFSGLKQQPAAVSGPSPVMQQSNALGQLSSTPSSHRVILSRHLIIHITYVFGISSLLNPAVQPNASEADYSKSKAVHVKLILNDHSNRCVGLEPRDFWVSFIAYTAAFTS